MDAIKSISMVASCFAKSQYPSTPARSDGQYPSASGPTSRSAVSTSADAVTHVSTNHGHMDCCPRWAALCSTPCPLLFTLIMSHPFPCSHSMVITSPFPCAAQRTALHPNEFVECTLQPLSKRNSMTEMFPCQLAQQNAVVPSIVAASISTRHSMTKYFTTSKCPFRAAQWSGVLPENDRFARWGWLGSQPHSSRRYRTVSKCPLPAAHMSGDAPLLSMSRDGM